MNIKIGSAGAYLWGCNQNYYGNVSKTCSALCNGGIIYESNTQSCQYQIWVYNENLILKDDVSSSKAYIYVSNDWEGFKNSDIEILRNNGVQFATILITEKSKHEIILSIIPIDKLPIVEEIKLEEIKVYSYRNYYIFLFIIIIGIIIIIIINKKLINN